MAQITVAEVTDPIIPATDERRTAFIQALRECATFLETHPTVKQPVYNVLNVFVNTKDELAAYARVTSWEKTYNGEWFWLAKAFGQDLRLDITVSRETVCRKVVTGTKVVPAVEAQPERVEETFDWVCEDASLLAVQS